MTYSLLLLSPCKLRNPPTVTGRFWFIVTSYAHAYVIGVVIVASDTFVITVNQAVTAVIAIIVIMDNAGIIFVFVFVKKLEHVIFQILDFSCQVFFVIIPITKRIKGVDAIC